MDDSETNVVERADDQPGKIARYVAEIDLYDRECQKWNTQAKKINRRYRDDRGNDGAIETTTRRFNVLWSNVQNLLPALYARNPKPDIQRRFKDADPIGRVTSDILERCVTYFCDTDHFAGTSRQCVLDYLLPGRGSLWVRYVPHFKPATELTDDIGPGDQTKAQAKAPEVIDYEEVIPDYVHRDDFGHNVARTWEEVWLVWRKAYLTQKELKSRFTNLKPEEIAQIPLDYKRKDIDGQTIDDGTAKAVIYEAWDKVRRVAVWFHKSLPDALDERPDPLKLNNFFPCPKPLLTNLTNDKLIPIPDYVEYQDQAMELDALTNRIAQMTKCIKVAGVHDASAEGIQRLFNEGTENETIPINNWAMFAGEKGGLQGVMELIDVKSMAETLLSLYEARAQVKNDLDEITGMSDIVRGQTDPNETASAQKIKAAYAGQRLSDRQKDVQRFIRETIRLMVDVICNHFQLDTIKQISGVRLLTQAEKQAFIAQQQQQPAPMGHNGGPPMDGQPAPQMAPPQPVAPPLPPGVTPDQMQDMMQSPSWEEVDGLIRNNAMRCFRIDIETDSTIKTDEEAEKASRIEFLTASGQFLEKAAIVGAQQPALVPLLGQMLMFGVRAFPVGKELEGAFNSAIQKLEKQAANPQPKPDPEMEKVKAEAQRAQMQAQIDAQLEQQRLQSDAQLEAMRTHMEEARAQREMQMEAQMRQIEANIEARLEIMKANIKAGTDVEIAQINAKAKAEAEPVGESE